MKLTVFDGCISFGINVNDRRLSDDDIETKKEIIRMIVDKVSNSKDIDMIIKDLVTLLEPIDFESNICSQCGDYSEYGDYELDEL